MRQALFIILVLVLSTALNVQRAFPTHRADHYRHSLFHLELREDVTPDSLDVPVPRPLQSPAASVSIKPAHAPANGAQPGGDRYPQVAPALYQARNGVIRRVSQQVAQQRPATQEKPPGLTLQEKRTQEALLYERGIVLLPKGVLVLAPSLHFSHVSRNRIAISGFTLFEAIIIGTLRVDQIKRDILSATLTGRYGITNRWEAELKVPYLYRTDLETLAAGTGDAADRRVTGNDIGDVEAALFYHAIRARGRIPDIILNLRGKTKTGRTPYEIKTETISIGGEDFPNRVTDLPTGSGHYGLAGGFTLVKTSDPVVFYGTFNYFWNIERNVGRDKGGEFGKVNPGNSIEYTLGMSLALSERISLSLSFLNRFTKHTEQKLAGASWRKLDGTSATLASFFIGTSYAISERISLLFSVGLGLTDDSPDFEARVSVPIRFSLF